MKLLIDQNLSPKLVDLLDAAGHDVEHVREHGTSSATDAQICAFAAEQRRVIISADTDFGTLLAATHATEPSFVLVRRAVGRRVPELAGLLIENLPLVENDLVAGAVVVLGERSIRIRQLPI